MGAPGPENPKSLELKFGDEQGEGMPVGLGSVLPENSLLPPIPRHRSRETRRVPPARTKRGLCEEVRLGQGLRGTTSSAARPGAALSAPSLMVAPRRPVGGQGVAARGRSARVQRRKASQTEGPREAVETRSTWALPCLAWGRLEGQRRHRGAAQGEEVPPIPGWTRFSGA